MYELDECMDCDTIHYKREDWRYTIDHIFIFGIYLLHIKNFIHQEDFFFK